MTQNKILLKDDELYCEGGHLVAKMLKDIGVDTKIKAKYFWFDRRQPTQKPQQPINPCFCGKPWIRSTNDNLALPVKIKRNNQFFIPVNNEK